LLFPDITDPIFLADLWKFVV